MSVEDYSKQLDNGGIGNCVLTRAQ
jgi:hypothetical protein